MDQKLKDFIDAHFDMPLLKIIGWVEKRKRKIDYEDVAKKLCTYFGFASPYEYGSFASNSETKHPTVINGKFPDQIDSNGNIIKGEGYHIDIVETEFVCPICTCSQDATEHKKYNNAKFPVVVIKCKGCKRKLQISNDMGGNLTVKEIV